MRREHLHQLFGLFLIRNDQGDELARGAGLELDTLLATLLDLYPLGGLVVDQGDKLFNVGDLLCLHRVRVSWVFMRWLVIL